MVKGGLSGDRDHMRTRDPGGYTGRRAGGIGFRYVLYEYAGFSYRVWIDEGGGIKGVEAVEGQHPASKKEKHLRAARECFIQDTQQ